MRWFLIVLGALLALVGGVWLLQGTGVLPGSVMSGQVFWARVGAVALLVGGALCITGRLGRRRHKGGATRPAPLRARR